jgi:hypothetical protein
MKRAKKEHVRFWGTDYDISPAIIEEVHGDGKNILWFEPMDTRPNGYYLRVDSSITKETSKEKMIELIEPWVFDSIIEECGQRYDEYDESVELEFPALAEESGCYTWHIMSDNFKLEVE